MNAPFTTLDDDTLDLGDLPRSLGFMLRLAQISSFAHFFREFADCDVKPGEFTVIWVIGLNPGVKQGALARTLHIKPAHMTKLVQRMVRDGLVRREIPSEDRRSVRLSLTPAGEAHLKRFGPGSDDEARSRRVSSRIRRRRCVRPYLRLIRLSAALMR